MYTRDAGKPNKIRLCEEDQAGWKKKNRETTTLLAELINIYSKARGGGFLYSRRSPFLLCVHTHTRRTREEVFNKIILNTRIFIVLNRKKFIISLSLSLCAVNIHGVEFLEVLPRGINEDALLKFEYRQRREEKLERQIRNEI